MQAAGSGPWGCLAWQQPSHIMVRSTVRNPADVCQAAMHCQPQHGWDGWGDWDGASNLWNQSNLMVSWWGMKPWQANTRHHSKLLFWKCCRVRSPDRYFTQAGKPTAWGLPRASAPWSLSFPREGLVSAMLVGFGHLRAKILPCWSLPECSSCLPPQKQGGCLIT